MRLLLVIIMGSLPLFGFSQDPYIKKGVGFGCGYSGKMTRPTKRMIKFFKRKKYKKIKEGLISSSKANQFLAVVFLEYLENEQKLKLTEKEKQFIKEIKQSKGIIYACSGCTYFGEFSLRQLFHGNHFYENSLFWISRFDKNK